MQGSKGSIPTTARRNKYKPSLRVVFLYLKLKKYTTMNTSAAQKGRSEKTLNTLVSYSEGVMTRKKWLELQFKNGSTVEVSTKNRVEFNRTKYNRMSCYKEQEEYEKKCNEQVVCYNLNLKDKSFYHITKFEYEYFLTLN